ncbi:MAG: PIG-L family deacetylase [Opitutae bacterium]|nr:PIG-L family deacetylase [Opitutae bacterium]
MAAPRLSTRQRAKEFLRRRAIKFCGGLLHLTSQPYHLGESPTVVIAPHQDDETLACGGIIARKRNEGLPVHVIFITDGSASHPGHPRFDRPAIAALRTTEAMKAMHYLGVERSAVHFLNEPDGTLNTITSAHRENLVRRLAALLGSIAPGEIFLPCNPDGSSEHDATFGFVTDALSRTGLRPDVWQYPVWSWWNPLLLLRRWLATTDCRQLALEDYRQAKAHAIRCYQSQIAPLGPDAAAALPADLVNIFHADTEYFFRHPLPPAGPKPP